jgi:hypothetical protein
MTLSCCFWNSPLVSLWSGIVEAGFSRDSRLQGAPTVKIFAMIGLCLRGSMAAGMQGLARHL